MSHTARIASLGITIPTPASPIANYVRAVRVGNILFMSGQISIGGDEDYIGKVDLNPAKAKRAARQCALNLMGNMQLELGTLDKVKRIIKLTGFINATPDYYAIPAIMDGASDIFVEVFGENGRHARSTIGASVLPRNCMVEVEAIIEVE